MRTRAVRAVALAACLTASLPSLLADQPAPPRRLFDGAPRVFVVNGYSTSRRWPQMLQRKLDRYFDGERVIGVRSAIKGGTPIAGWIDVETGDRLPALESNRAALQRQDDRPTIVLAEQSLQWAYGERFAGIRGPRIGSGSSEARMFSSAMPKHSYKTGPIRSSSPCKFTSTTGNR